MLVIPRPFGGLSAVPFPSAGFHPKDLPQARAVYQISDLSTLKQERTGASATTPAAVNGPVGTVLDLSGNGNHAVAPSDSGRPILRQSGSLYYLEFDGSNDWLNIDNANLLSADLDALVTMGLTWRATGYYPYAFGTRPLDHAVGDALFANTTTYRIGVALATASPIGANGTAVSLGTPFVNELDWTRFTGTLLGKRNGTTNASLTVTPANLRLPATGYSIAGANAQNERAAGINVYCVVVCSGSLTTQVKTQIREWVAGQTGVTL